MLVPLLQMMPINADEDPTVLDLSAVRDAYLAAPEEAVFLERAAVLHEAKQRYADMPAGLRQGRILQDLCEQVSVIVGPHDILLGRIREQVPTAEQEAFVRDHPELFSKPGMPGWLESAGIYIPDWAHLLRVGIGGLVHEVEQQQREADTSARDVLEGTRLSLLALSTLIARFGRRARRVAETTEDSEAADRLRRAADACDAVALAAPTSLHEALQLFISFHMALSCLVGGRNVTPGRADQYLFPFYRKDIAEGALRREDAVTLLAVMMTMLSQLSGHVATDFQSRKRTPNRFSHYYITLGGVTPDGRGAVNDLSHAFLEARRLVEFRDPSLCLRYFPGIDRTFWRKGVALMRDGLPVFTYNDGAVIAAHGRLGVPEELARDYAICGCMLCTLPGRDMPPLRANHNGPRAVLLAMNGGVDPVSGRQSGDVTPPTEEIQDFDAFFDAFRRQLRAGLERTARQYADGQHAENRGYPLLARCLLEGYPDGSGPGQYADQCLVGVATTIDSLLAVREAVYARKKLTLAELRSVLSDDFEGHEPLRLYLQNRMPSYGCDDPPVTEMIERFSQAWVEEVARADGLSGRVRMRPAFYSWLFNIELGQNTGATPDGRRRGAPLSSDQTPTQGKCRGPTEALSAIAHLAHDHTCSGGTTFRLSPSHFRGDGGLDRLAALIEGYFAQGGLQIQFIFADAATLRDAVENPDAHRDLLVRVAGFSEYFVRLLPEVQRDIIQRAEYEGA